MMLLFIVQNGVSNHTVSHFYLTENHKLNVVHRGRCNLRTLQRFTQFTVGEGKCTVLISLLCYLVSDVLDVGFFPTKWCTNGVVNVIHECVFVLGNVRHVRS